MSRPRARTLASGPKRGSARPMPGTSSWWARRAGHKGLGGRAVTSWSAADRLVVNARADRRLPTLAAVAAAVQAAADADGVLRAVGDALSTLGLNGHSALVDAQGRGLVIRSAALSSSGLAQVERVLGGAVVGAHIDLEVETPYRQVVRGGRALRVETPLWWARLFAPALGPVEARAVGTLIRLGEAALAPISAGGRVLGVLTVWAERLSDGDVAAAELLGQIAGGSLLQREQLAALARRPTSLPSTPRVPVAVPA